ncbi:MAG: ABC transporter ATP-binding protein [Candidatus Dojkabacteria bacterium]|nr:ABC transporter ATP-binding protein [Candidatus Dojkabacteria bacterium]MDQ7020728.1 ABC transporter ATP-binding protein [Candidatus Dojkabacteria bacterium]
MEVNKGEIFGFLGPNGAGKSTTIRTILDFIRPTSGKVEIFGLDSFHHSEEVKKKIGYLAGDSFLYMNMNGYDLLKHISYLSGGIKLRYLDSLVTKLKADLSKPIKSLSKGNRQKIGIITALMNKPDLLILDEPTSGFRSINETDLL